MKQIIRIFLLYIIILCFSNVDVFANETNNTDESSIIDQGICGDGVGYTIFSNGDLVIKGRGYGTGRIYDDMYKNTNSVYFRPFNTYNDLIKNVIIEDGVTYIDENTFINCSLLEKVEISSSVQEIGSSAFNNCISINDIKLSDGLKQIDYYAFNNCCNIKKLYIPETVEKIEMYAFNECARLEEINIPSKITELKTGLFSGCRGLKKFLIPDTVTKISGKTFYGYENLEFINIPRSVQIIDCNLSHDFDSNVNGKYTLNAPFVGTTEFLKIYVEDKENVVNWPQYWNSVNVDSKGVVTYNNNIFYGCSFNEYTNLIMNDNKDNNVFDNISSLQIPEYSFYNNSVVTEIIIPEGVESIGKSAFEGCKNLRKIVLPSSLKKIGDSAFKNCSSLESMTIPNGVEIINAETFSGCTELNNIDFPDSLISINGTRLFKDCVSLQNIYIPANVTKIYYDYSEDSSSSNIYEFSPFRGCSNLANIVCGSSENNNYVTYWDRNPLLSKTKYNYTREEYLWLVDAINNISYGVLKIKDGTKRIPHNAFENNIDIEEIIIPDSVVEIEDYAFFCCYEMKKIVMSQNIKKFGKQSFAGCYGLNHFKFPDTTECIEAGAFNYCNLSTVYIPKNVISIMKTDGEDISYPFDTSNRDLKIFCENTSKPDGWQSGWNYSGHGFLIKTFWGISNEDYENESNDIHDYSLKIMSDEYRGALPTCNHKGTDYYYACRVCFTCGTQTYNDGGDYGDHYWATEYFIDSTCEKEGSRKNVCIVCKKENRESIPKKDHTIVIDEEIKPTCVNSGLSKGSHCSICQKVIQQQEVIPPKGHSDIVIINNIIPTCKSEGYTGDKYCKDCDEVVSFGNVIPKTDNHIWNDGKETQNALCTREGIKTYTCSVCETTKTESIPATGKHINMELCNKKVATCGEDGYTGDIYCKDCNTLIKQGSLIEKTGNHTYSEWRITKTATCTEEGSRIHICTICQSDESEVIPTTRHSLEKIEKIDATCEKDGHSEYWLCHTCKKIFADAEGKTEITSNSLIIPANGHELQKTDKVKAGCITDVCKEHWTCKNCNKLFADFQGITEIALNELVIQASGHNYEKGICSVCGLQKSFSLGSLTYTVIKTEDDTETVSVKATQKINEEIIIPDIVQDDNVIYSVAVIEENAFIESGQLTMVTIPETVKIIQENAFSGCAKLQNVTFEGMIAPDIANTAFSNVTNNMRITIPKNATGYFGHSALNGIKVVENNNINNNENNNFSNDIQNTTISSGNEKVSVTSDIVKVSGIHISGISNNIAAGKKIKLTGDIFPSNAANKAVTWTSSNTKVATVTQSGIVTMNKKSAGKSAIITATAVDGSGVKAFYKIKSMKGFVKKVTINGVKAVKVGKRLKLKAKVSATTGANKKIMWISNNSKYATVSSSGLVKTFSAGKGKKVKITAMATDGSNKKKTITIKIK